MLISWSFFLTPAHRSHTLGRAASWKRLSDSLTWWNGLHHGPQTHTGPSRWVNLKIKFSRHGVFNPVKTWFTSKAGSKHGQKDRSFLLASAHPGERRGPRCPTYCTWGHSDLFSRIQVPARAQLFLFILSSSLSRSLFVLSGLEKLLSILIEHYHKDNKRQYQQFLSSVVSLGRQRDNIKGSTLISGEHVKPCNETSWNCLITAQEMKLQDDSLIKQWLRIFCLLSNTVRNAF